MKRVKAGTSTFHTALEDGEPELVCDGCGTFNRRTRIFCLRCMKRLFPLTPLDISKSDFTYPGDESNLRALQGTEPLPRLAKRLVAPGEKRIRSWLVENATRVYPPSELDMHVRVCGEILGLEMMPEVYLAPTDGVNAFTTGSEEHPILVVSSPALEVLERGEVQALVSHELAHLKSRHLLYHTLAESMAAGTNLLAHFFGAGIISLPLKLLLLAWYRDSEVSADRAALLTSDELRTFESLMGKLLLASGPDARAVKQGGPFTDAFKTHPAIERRLELAREFAGSPEFSRARLKVRRRAERSGVLVRVCRFCDVIMRVSEEYCPTCGRGQR